MTNPAMEPAEIMTENPSVDGSIEKSVVDVADSKSADAVAVAPLGLDLSKKKKKKKPKMGSSAASSVSFAPEIGGDTLDSSGIDGAAQPSEPELLDFALPDFTGKKKRKKKKVFFDDDLEDGTGADMDRTSRREALNQPWDGTDRDYTYSELINRAFQYLHGKNPALAAGTSGRKKILLQLPQVAREGTKKTVFLNFGATCKSIHRQQEHLLAYMGAELGTNGNIQDGGRLVIKGRFTAESIVKVITRYMKEYVICTSCRSPDTVLMRDANTRLYFVSCESCGAKRSVTPIRQGFMAQVERRKKA